MFRNKYLFQIFIGIGLIFCAAGFGLAQKTVTSVNLVKFEKSIEQGNYVAIERDLLNYVIANPTDAKGFALLGKLRFAQNRFNEAKSSLLKSLSLDPRLTSAKIDLAVINFQTGNGAQTVSGLDAITDGDVSTAALRLRLAQAYALAGDCQKALNNVEKLDLKIKNGEALPLRAECYLRAGEKQKVGQLIPLTKSSARVNPVVAIKFAEVIGNSGMFKESADILRSVVSTAPQNTGALISLAKYEIYTKELASAKIHLNQAAKINPNSADLLITQSLLESVQGNTTAALDLMEKSLAANPNSTTVLSQFVIVAIRARYAGKAVKAAERLLELKPDEPDFLYLHGAASLQNNNLPVAETSLTRFAELRPQDSRGCLALGLTYAAQVDKLELARRQLQHCLEIDQDNFEALYQLGLSYKSQGEIAKAIEYFEATIKISPDYALALKDLGVVYLQSGAEGKARAALEKSVAINPNDSDAHFQLSRLYNLIGEPGLAKKHLEIFQKLKNPSQNGM